jgi:dipeptidyl aminopeptidase/acylaminoacyl peptidase
MLSEKRRITAEDLYKFELISSMEISPDGAHVVYTQQRINPDDQKKYSNLWVISVEDGTTRQFTHGDQVDSNPRWSPDGRRIAFISNREDEKRPQIYLLNFFGGEAKPLTDLNGEFNNFEWSPDGKQIVTQFRKKDQEVIDREEDEKVEKLGVVLRHIDRLEYKYDGAGFLPKERWHIWVIDTISGETSQLTEDPKYDETSPTWLKDGEQILFISNRAENPDIDYDLKDFFIIPARGGEVVKLEAPDGDKSFPSVSPDGKWLAYIAMEKRKEWWQNDDLWVLPVDGSTEARNLTKGHDIHVSPDVINDMNAGAVTMIPPIWSLDGTRLFFPVARNGSSTIRSISIDGDDLVQITDGQETVGMFGFDETQSTMVYFCATMKDPGQIRAMNMSSGEFRQLSNFNSWLSQIDIGEVEEVWFQGRDSNNLQGWILTPPGFDLTRKYPSILEIHGGPMVQYGHFFMHEFYYLAAQGYVVYFSNPRGGQGYGEAHTRTIWANWGDADYADLMIWADQIRSRTFIDSERMGVTGGSYGGYMTLWVIGHTHQFKAAVAQRVVSNFISMWGSSDMNWKMQHLTGDTAPIDDFQTAWNHSPVKYLGNATTPTLIIHSEEDNRCPIEQGEQAFVTLKFKGVETEMVRFPGEPHGLSRGGRTDRRIARLDHILRWMDKFLKST